jgi:hypothetical protein
MTVNRVVSRKNLPMPCPLTATILTALVFDRLHVSPVCWGVAGTILTFAWIIWIGMRFFVEQEIRIWEAEKK